MRGPIRGIAEAALPGDPDEGAASARFKRHGA